jgi:hypothetical protein
MSALMFILWKANFRSVPDGDVVRLGQVMESGTAGTVLTKEYTPILAGPSMKSVRRGLIRTYVEGCASHHIITCCGTDRGIVAGQTARCICQIVGVYGSGLEIDVIRIKCISTGNSRILSRS